MDGKRAPVDVAILFHLVLVPAHVCEFQALLECRKPESARFGAGLARIVRVLGDKDDVATVLGNGNVREVLALYANAVLDGILYERHGDEGGNHEVGVFELYVELQVVGFVEPELLEVRVLLQDFHVFLDGDEFIRSLVERDPQ